MKKISKKSILIFMLFLCIIGVSCSNTTPELNSVFFKVIPAIGDTSSRMIVFVEVLADISSIDFIQVKHIQSGKLWMIEEPELFQDRKSGSYFAGSSFLVPEQNAEFPRGEYIVTYTNRAQQETKLEFFYAR